MKPVPDRPDQEAELQMPVSVAECHEDWNCSGYRILNATSEARRFIESTGVNICTCHCICNPLDDGGHDKTNLACPVVEVA